MESLEIAGTYNLNGELVIRVHSDEHNVHTFDAGLKSASSSTYWLNKVPYKSREEALNQLLKYDLILKRDYETLLEVYRKKRSEKRKKLEGRPARQQEVQGVQGPKGAAAAQPGSPATQQRSKQHQAKLHDFKHQIDSPTRDMRSAAEAKSSPKLQKTGDGPVSSSPGRQQRTPGRSNSSRPPHSERSHVPGHQLSSPVQSLNPPFRTSGSRQAPQLPHGFRVQAPNAPSAPQQIGPVPEPTAELNNMQLNLHATQGRQERVSRWDNNHSKHPRASSTTSTLHMAPEGLPSALSPPGFRTQEPRSAGRSTSHHSRPGTGTPSIPQSVMLQHMLQDMSLTPSGDTELADTLDVPASDNADTALPSEPVYSGNDMEVDGCPAADGQQQNQAEDEAGPWAPFQELMAFIHGAVKPSGQDVRTEVESWLDAAGLTHKHNSNGTADVEMCPGPASGGNAAHLQRSHSSGSSLASEGAYMPPSLPRGKPGPFTQGNHLRAGGNAYYRMFGTDEPQNLDAVALNVGQATGGPGAPPPGVGNPGDEDERPGNKTPAGGAPKGNPNKAAAQQARQNRVQPSTADPGRARAADGDRPAAHGARVRSSSGRRAGAAAHAAAAAAADAQDGSPIRELMRRRMTAAAAAGGGAGDGDGGGSSSHSDEERDRGSLGGGAAPGGFRGPSAADGQGARRPREQSQDRGADPAMLGLAGQSPQRVDQAAAALARVVGGRDLQHVMRQCPQFKPQLLRLAKLSQQCRERGGHYKAMAEECLKASQQELAAAREAEDAGFVVTGLVLVLTEKLEDLTGQVADLSRGVRSPQAVESSDQYLKWADPHAQGTISPTFTPQQQGLLANAARANRQLALKAGYDPPFDEYWNQAVHMVALLRPPQMNQQPSILAVTLKMEIGAGGGSTVWTCCISEDGVERSSALKLCSPGVLMPTSTIAIPSDMLNLLEEWQVTQQVGGHRNVVQGGTAFVLCIPVSSMGDLLESTMLSLREDAERARGVLVSKGVAPLAAAAQVPDPLVANGNFWMQCVPALEMPTYCGTLADLLMERDLTARELSIVMCQLADGLDHIHLHNIIHRDLKTENTLIKYNTGVLEANPGTPWEHISLESATIVIADMDLAVRRVGNDASGTPLLMSPQQAAGVRHTCKADIWAAGQLAADCLVGRDYADELREEQQPDGAVRNATARAAWLTQQAADNNDMLPGFDKPCTAELLEMLEGMLQEHEQNRWDTEDLLRCRFVARGRKILHPAV